MSIEQDASTVRPGMLRPTEAAAESAIPVLRPRRTIWGDMFRRLWANKLAVTGGVFVSIMLLAAIFAPLIAPKGYTAQDYANLRTLPNSEFWLGTDAAGRDMWARIIYGARVSFTVGLLTQAIALFVGVPLGLIAGYFGGWVDNAIMRVVDVLYAFPLILFATLLMAWLRPGLSNVILALSITGWLVICRLVRAQVMSLRSREFIEAARVVGTPNHRILLGHVLPNTMSAIIIAVTFAIPQAIFAEAALSFIGVGVNPPTPSWGQMVSDNILYIRSAWHLAVFPALALGMTMLAFTTFGDGLRDAFDPRGKR
jgi:ABC-type dipeptide/oligopeptide/nickel transport system permease subunit